jgi:AraC-like DNA-binding protein
MKDARLSLTEVALNCGFGSSSQFATTFRRIDGRTPSAYRRTL